MLVNKASIKSTFISLKTIFQNAFDAAPTQWQETAMRVTSDSASNDYSWLSAYPRIRKWIGDKAVRALGAFKYTIVNEDWEATLHVKRNDIKDDKLGQYAPQAQMAGYSAKQLPDEIISELKDKGFENKCYDQQYFYDTDHPVDDGNGNIHSVSNKGTAPLSARTRKQAEDSYGAARTAIMEFKDDEGRPLALIPNVLEVPSALETVGRSLLENEKLDDGKPNPYRGTAKLLVNPRLASRVGWFLHVTSMPIKPFIYQEREEPSFVEQTDESSDDVFNRAIYKFGAEARAAGGYAFWQMSYGSTGTAASGNTSKLSAKIV